MGYYNDDNIYINIDTNENKNGTLTIRKVRLEGLGYFDSSLSLVVLQERTDDAGGGAHRGIQHVYVLNLKKWEQ